MKTLDSMLWIVGLCFCFAVGAEPAELAAADAANGDVKSFVGEWRVGRPNGPDFVIGLREDHTATTSLSKTTGRWAYVNGEAQITWASGSRNVIRREGSGFKKLFWKAGTRPDAPPTDTGKAEKIAPGKGK